MTQDVQANKLTATQFLQHAFSMRMAAAISMLTDDATWWVIGDPSQIRVAGPKNHEKTVRMMSNMHKALPNGMRHHITAITAEADRVAVEVEAEGSWYDGRPYRNQYHFLFRIRNAKVASIREYMDPMQLL